VDAQLRALDHQAAALSESVAEVAAGLGLGGGDPPSLPRAADHRVPVRLTRGPLAGGLPASRLPAGRAAWYESASNPLLGDYPFELVNFIDGKRDVTAIRDALSAEFGPLPTEAVARYVEDLVAAGLASWK